MASTPIILVNPSILGTSVTNVGSAPVGGYSYIDKMVIVNYSPTVPVIVNVWIETQDNQSIAISSQTIAPNKSYLCPEVSGRVLKGGVNIYASASVADIANINATGRQIT